MEFKQSGADWTEVFSKLKNAIKTRHYSPKTLKAYSGWLRQFQTYTTPGGQIFLFLTGFKYISCVKDKDLSPLFDPPGI